jgi:hypothetical protein
MSDYDEETNVHSSSSDEHHFSPVTEENDDSHLPSAPPTSDDNGYVVVSENTQQHHGGHQDKESLHESLNKDFADITSSVDASISKLSQRVLAEADSSTSIKEVVAPKNVETTKKEKSSECSLCPYYALGKRLLIYK